MHYSSPRLLLRRVFAVSTTTKASVKTCSASGSSASSISALTRLQSVRSCLAKNPLLPVPIPSGVKSKSFSTSTRIMAGKPNVVFVLGAPGAGKGTQCQKIVEKFGYVHLSAGDLLRAERKSPGSQYGELIENYITEGKIVPVAITCSLLEKAMNESDKNDFLIDGFPRNEDNLTGWNSQMGDKVNLKFVLFFDCSEEVCLQRVLGRGAAGSGRSDDNVESLKKRFETYVNASMPIIEHFQKLGLAKKIKADRDVDEVFADVEKCFNA